MLFSAPNGTSSAEEFVKYWIDQTLDQTNQGLHIRNLLTANDLNPIFLYGNHDNYLKKFPTTSYNGVSKRKACYRASGLYVEHGHRNCEFNRDGELKGWGITQLVFHNSKIRNLEEKASELYAQRPFSKGPNKLIYMGEAIDTLMGNIPRPFPDLINIVFPVMRFVQSMLWGTRISQF